jgi:3-methyladenine DNA glycosylase AlkD
MADQISVEIVQKIRALGNEKRANELASYFQTQRGGYGYGDEFCGVNMPTLRKVAASYDEISLESAEELLHNALHEARMVALVILVKRFSHSPEDVFVIYKRNTNFMNNWDLVDIAASAICGNYCLATKDSGYLRQLAKSENLWENRIAIVATLAFIEAGQLDLTIDLCKHFLSHRHHLIHKACGWMLRELGKVDEQLLLGFANTHKLPGIMRSYALEKISAEKKRKIN